MGEIWAAGHPWSRSDQYDPSLGKHPGIGMEYSGYVEPGGYDQVVIRGDPTIKPDASPEFVAFWVKGGRVLAGMNVNVWDVQDDIQKLVRAGYAGKAVDLATLADPPCIWGICWAGRPCWQRCSSRSEFFTQAARRFLAELEESLTARIDAAPSLVEGDDSAEFAAAAGRRLLESLEDEW